MLPLTDVYGMDAPLRSRPGIRATSRSYSSTLLGGSGRRVTIAPAMLARLILARPTAGWRWRP